MEPKHLPHSGVRQAEIMLSLSLATDLGTGRAMESALCSALIGIRLGEAIGLSEPELRDIYYLSLLRFVGCTAEMDGTLALFGDDPTPGARAMDYIEPSNPLEMFRWGLQYLAPGTPLPHRIQTAAQVLPTMSRQSFGHCEVARRFAERMELDESIHEALWYIYERWDGKGMPRHIGGETLPQTIRVVHLAQDVETYRRSRGIEAAVAVARERAGRAYDPGLVERFAPIAPRLLVGLDEADWNTVLDAEPGARPYLSEQALDEAALTVADFTDLVAPFFAAHSRNVGALAAEAARQYGLPEADVKAAERMGWLHDFGKAGVPPGFWRKPRPLTASEWERVRLHPYYTERILAQSPRLSALGNIAGLHHERLDGSGYHRGLSAGAIPPSGLLLAAANFYQAKIEPRPFREAQSPESAAHALRQEAQAGRLDGDAVKAVLAAAGHHTTPVRRDRVAGLSEREIEVLRLIAQGLSNRQMAQHLSISEKTVGNHVMHIYEKIDVSTRSGATLFAMQHHLVGTHP